MKLVNIEPLYDALMAVHQHDGMGLEPLVAMSDIIPVLDEAPTIDAAFVVHGRWIETMIPVNTTGYGGIGQDKKKGLLCSNCRCAFDVILLWSDNYCPSCGAKMDLEVQ